MLLKRTLFLSLLSLSVLTGIAGCAGTGTKFPGTHPYLYADKGDFRSLSKSKDGTVAELRSIVIEEADKVVTTAVNEVARFSAAEITLNLRVARLIQGRLLYLSAAYNLTGDEKYSDVARSLIANVISWENWGTSHFLDIGETAFAVGVAYDWLFDVLSDEEKHSIEQAVVAKAFDPYFRSEEGGNSWVKGDFNWNQVCHGGVSVAALAIYDSNPDLCRRVVERAAECVPYATSVYAPDGAFPEGPSYWEYGTSFQVLMMEAMRSALGHCFGLDECEGFMETADFRLQVRGNTGLEYGYSDYHKSFQNEPVMMWFARELGRYDLQADEMSRIREIRNAGSGLSRQTVFDLIWWSRLKAREKKSDRAIECWFAEGDMPLAVMRTDKSRNDAYVAFKGGTADHSHGHMDSGSFIYESRGVRWALDLGTENYDKMRSAGLDLWNYQPESSRWTTFRPSSESHNILRIDGAPILSTASASNMTFSETPQCCSATLDITGLYAKSPVSSVLRTVALEEDGNLRVTDEVAASDNVELSFQWITDASAIADGCSVRLEKDGRSAVLYSDDADSVRIEDVSSVPGIQNSPNPGVKRIVFARKIAGGLASRMEIKLVNE